MTDAHLTIVNDRYALRALARPADFEIEALGQTNLCPPRPLR